MGEGAQHFTTQQHEPVWEGLPRKQTVGGANKLDTPPNKRMAHVFTCNIINHYHITKWCSKKIYNYYYIYVMRREISKCSYHGHFIGSNCIGISLFVPDVCMYCLSPGHRLYSIKTRCANVNLWEENVYSCGY